MISIDFDDMQRIYGIYNMSCEYDKVRINQYIIPSLIDVDYCSKLIKFLKSKCENQFNAYVTCAQYHNNLSAYNSIVSNVVDYPTMEVDLYTQRAYDMYITFHKLHNYFNL